jgi:hypothetical protein
MRTVLAVDEMLGYAVKRELDGDADVEVFDHLRMRDEGMGAVRAAVLKEPSVLVIGSRAWDALPELRAMRLPRDRPVVLLTPAATWERQATAYRLGVVAIVPCNDGTDTRVAILDEIELAWSASRQPPLAAVLVERARRSPSVSREGRLIQPQVPAWLARYPIPAPSHRVS